jgi:DNA-binding CsgD family transcriptional regulator
MSELHAHAVAGYLAACGDVEGARRTLRGALDDPRTAPYGILLLARLLDLDGNSPGETANLLDTLIDIARGQVSPWSKTTLHRTVGIVRRDRESLALAVREAAAGGLVFERARAQLVLGELAADAGDELVEAYRTFARLGAHGLRRRAGRRLHGLGEKVPRSRSRAAAGLLTESEERVARLVQQGMRNREIAAALHYSPRSVEVYLSRIYGKLRVSSRLELARALDAIDASA